MLSDLIRVKRSLKTLEFDYKLPNVWILSPTNLRSVTLLDWVLTLIGWRNKFLNLIFWPANVIIVIKHSQIICSNCLWEPNSSRICPSRLRSFSDWDAKASFLTLGFFVFRAACTLSSLLNWFASGFATENAKSRFWESKNKFRVNCSMRVASRSHNSISFTSDTYLNYLCNCCSNILYPWLLPFFADLFWLYFWSSATYIALAFS